MLSQSPIMQLLIEYTSGVINWNFGQFYQKPSDVWLARFHVLYDLWNSLSDELCFLRPWIQLKKVYVHGGSEINWLTSQTFIVRHFVHATNKWSLERENENAPALVISEKFSYKDMEMFEFCVCETDEEHRVNNL